MSGPGQCPCAWHNESIHVRHGRHDDGAGIPNGGWRTTAATIGKLRSERGQRYRAAGDKPSRKSRPHRPSAPDLHVTRQLREAAKAVDIELLDHVIRRASGLDTSLATFDDTVRKNFQSWIMARHSGPHAKFTEQQLAWLQMIRDHVSTSFHLERDDLDMAPFDSEGGLGKMFQLFGARMDPLIAELNEALVA